MMSTRRPAFAISIHAPRTGSDGSPGKRMLLFGNFNPRSPHGERHQGRGTKMTFSQISIHAPRTGSDHDRLHGGRSREPISIHAPRTGSDGRCLSRWRRAVLFQSTLPARGATVSFPGVMPFLIYFNPRSPHGERPERPDSGRSREPDFNPRSPHGERPKSSRAQPGRMEISIHAPRTGSDRGRVRALPHFRISIHAPRTGSDSCDAA